jgi:two-component system sensor histidine kinase HydH
MEKTATQIFSLDRTIFTLNKSKVSARTLARMGLIISAVFLITLFHYKTAPEAGMRHVIFRELYIVPIILGGFWFGIRGGLATALLVSILYGPFVLMGPDRFTPHDLGNVMEIFLFNLIGGTLGWLKDRESLQQARLREAENLAAMGRATAMIAHDLKTPLITIAGLARRLSGKIVPASSEGEKIMVIRQQAERLEKLVMDMLFFAKPTKLRLASADLCHLLAEAKKAVQETTKYSGVNIALLTEAPCICHFDHEKMMLVIINLFTNAIEASPADEIVSVSLQDDTGKISIEISDRGTGIPENLKGKVFEPFVTGKPKGTGLGLPICKKIVEAHSGQLEYSNNADGGATFRIVIHRGH